jgi:hypothetical protein
VLNGIACNQSVVQVRPIVLIAFVADIDDTLLESGAHPGQEWIDAQVAFIRKLQALASRLECRPAHERV